jgi:hypothetical protein
MYVRTDCSSCEHKRWEDNWSSKLERARTFLAELIEKHMPGVNEISALVKELDDLYYMASWDARNMASHAFKKSVARVDISDHSIARSPLTQEVRPEDVVDPKEKEKKWTDMDENDNDGDYIASTDPIHPVSTDYSHPLDDDDGSWILQHISPGATEISGDGEVALDFDQDGWSWNNDDSENSVSMIAACQEEDTMPTVDSNHLITWEPEAEMSSMATDITMDGLSIREKLEKEQIELIIEAFWTVVDKSTDTDQQLQPCPLRLPYKSTHQYSG